MAEPALSVVLPARNEAVALRELLPRLQSEQPGAEILVVDDGSTDDTPAVCADHGVVRIAQPEPMGNGAAVKAGARVASGAVLVFMDADGQHDPEDIAPLVAALDDGYAMAVGARRPKAHGSRGRALANAFYNRLASLVTGFPIRDLTSGMRAVRADLFRRLLPLLPNGFSYPATSTLAILREGYPVAYRTAEVRPRQQGKSHIRPLHDGVRFLLVIFKISTFYSPLRVFLPASLVLGAGGVGYYVYTFVAHGSLTNGGTLLITTAILVFLIGLVAEMVTHLLYKEGP